MSWTVKGNETSTGEATTRLLEDEHDGPKVSAFFTPAKQCMYMCENGQYLSTSTSISPRKGYIFYYIHNSCKIWKKAGCPQISYIPMFLTIRDLVLGLLLVPPPQWVKCFNKYNAYNMRNKHPILNKLRTFQDFLRGSDFVGPLWYFPQIDK